MSKIVRAVGRVVKGAANVVKRVVKSPLGKLALTAAAVYFAVPAVTGALGGGATGTMMGNLSAAWQGLSGAAGSALAGNFAQAGTQLGAGMLGGSSAMLAPTTAGFLGENVKSGINAWDSAGKTAGMFANPYMAPALVQAGGQVIQGIGGAVSQREFQKREDEKEEDARKRYNTNVGTRLWPKG